METTPWLSIKRLSHWGSGETTEAASEQKRQQVGSPRRRRRPEGPSKHPSAGSHKREFKAVERYLDSPLGGNSRNLQEAEIPPPNIWGRQRELVISTGVQSFWRENFGES